MKKVLLSSWQERFRPGLALMRLKRGCCVALLVLAGAAWAQAQAPDVFDQIVQNVASQELKSADVPSEDAKTKGYMAAIAADGSFADIDYASKAQTNWPAIAHLDRMKSMIISYVSPTSAYCGADSLYDDIVSALSCWYAKNPTSTNWYMWEIGWPQRMGVNLSLMRGGKKQVPADIEAKTLARMRSLSKGPNQAGSQGTGANKMDIALQWIYRASLQRNQADLDFAVEQFFMPLKFNTGEGLQSDYSYLQHGMQLYIGGYGASVLTATLKVAYYLVGTNYASSSDYMDYISKFVRLTYMPVIRGQYMLHGAIGRGMVRTDGTRSAGFYGSLNKMIDLDPAYTDYYRLGIERLKGNAPASYGVTPYHRHYWRGDYTLHQRPGYTLDVRMASTRTARCENGNGENLKGYFLTEGGMQIVRRGDEYVDIYPAWDWARIPGTTTPAVSAVPQPAQWGQSGQSRFAGGVSDSIYGVTAYQMVDKTNGINTTGKKAWFFFDKEVVCLGADIASTNAAAVNTTVNQCLLNGDVTVLKEGDGAAVTFSQGTAQTYDGALRWLNHDSVSYYFPEGGKLTVSSKTQSGTWLSLVSTASSAVVKKDVLKLYFDHGVKPTAGTYAYWIVPGTGSIDEARQGLDDIETLNTDSVQAAYNKTLDLFGAVFHKPARLRLGGVEVNVSAPCVLMFRDVSSKSVKTYVADPSCTLDTLTVYAKFQALPYKALGCKLDRSDFYAGSTHAYTIDAATPDSVYTAVQALTLSATALSLTYDKLAASVTATVSPATATHPEVTWRSSDEAVALVDQGGHVVALNGGEARLTAATRDGVTATVDVQVAEGVRTLAPLADTYIYDKQPNGNFGTATYVTVRRDGTNYNRRGLFLFPLTGFGDTDLGGSGTKVKIALYATSAYNRAYECKWLFYPCADTDWAENAMTWNKRPATSALIGTVPCFVPDEGDFAERNIVELDITDYAVKQYGAGQTALTVFIDQDKQATGGKGSTDFASKEHADALKRPRIVFCAETVNAIGAPTQGQSAVSATVRDGQLLVLGAKGTPVSLYDVHGVRLRQLVLGQSGLNAFSIADMPASLYIVRAGGTVLKFRK